MKKNLTLITLLSLFIINFVVIADAAQRRAGTTAARGIFSRDSSTGLGRSFTSKSFKSATPVTCPRTARSFFTESESTFSKARKFGQQAREFAARHPKKLFIAGATGIATGAYNINKTLSEREKKIRIELREFKALLDKNSYSKWEKDEIIASIKKLKAADAINTKLHFFGSPLTMVIRKRWIYDRDETDLIKVLIENGARPDKQTITSALGFHYDNLNYIKSNYCFYLSPNYKALKIILPYADQKKLYKFIEIMDSNIDKIQNDLKALEFKKQHFQEYIKHTIDHLQWKLEQNKDIKEQENIQSDIDYWKHKASDNEITEKLKKLRAETALFKNLKHIANNALNKGKLSGTSAYKEEDRTVAQ